MSLASGIIVGMKTCTKCLLPKHLIEFHKAVNMRDGHRTVCRQCDNATYRTKRAEHLELYKARELRRREQNREYNAARQRAYQKGKGKEIVRAYRKQWVQTEKGKLSTQAKSSRWRKTEKGRIASRIWTSRRRARLLGATGSFTSQDWIAILKAQKNICGYCGQRFTERKPPTIDHVLPLARGGTNDATNIVAACKSCNSKKWMH